MRHAALWHALLQYLAPPQSNGSKGLSLGRTWCAPQGTNSLNCVESGLATHELASSRVCKHTVETRSAPKTQQSQTPGETAWSVVITYSLKALQMWPC